ncbi:MAG: GNAT family N-acetyltransferase [Hyphomonas sp.]
MIVRSATQADHAALADLWFDSWMSIGIANETDLTREEVRARFYTEAATRWDLYTADDGGRLAGLLALVPGESRIDQIFVDPAGKVKGVGRLLMAHAKQCLPDGIVLVTHTDNKRARAFYAHHGFTLDRTEDDPVHRRQKCHYVWRPED